MASVDSNFLTWKGDQKTGHGVCREVGGRNAEPGRDRERCGRDTGRNAKGRWRLPPWLPCMPLVGCWQHCWWSAGYDLLVLGLHSAHLAPCCFLMNSSKAQNVLPVPRGHGTRDRPRPCLTCSETTQNPQPEGAGAAGKRSKRWGPARRRPCGVGDRLRGPQRALLLPWDQRRHDAAGLSLVKR